MSYIKENIRDIQTQIIAVCDRIGRDPSEVQLIAVTKTIDSARIKEAVAQGITDIGENKVQEIMDKHDDIYDVNYHMIGHLQTNKVKYIIDKVKLIHSVDKINLAEEINKRAKQHNKIMDILIQVNVAEEDSKFGIKSMEIKEFIHKIEGLENVRILGLMTIAPYEENPEDVRKYFRILKSIFDEIKAKNLPGVDMQYLSMGMTNDFEVAIEEGSTMVRIGTGIFGERTYLK